ncbi:MAG: SAM-dependent methyltransferase, partial [Pseudomonadota bacterium]
MPNALSPLATLIREEIAEKGPMSLARYMDLCLAHPEHGYYRTRDPLGLSGDFTTAPEISQIFGELIGLWLVQVWIDQGRPTPFALVELGPGRGTLMADILRAARLVPDFGQAAQVWLVETSQPLRAAQAHQLAPHLPETGPQWAARLEDVPALPLLLVANEFFDALPIHQYQWTGATWRERRVHCSDTTLILHADGEPAPPSPLWRLPDAPLDGDCVEVSPLSAAVAGEIGQRLTQRGGAALVVDYAYEEPSSGRWTADTFQAMRSHRLCDP